MRYAFAITAVVGALWGGEVGAAQQSACATHETMTKQLGIRYDETQRLLALRDPVGNGGCARVLWEITSTGNPHTNADRQDA